MKIAPFLMGCLLFTGSITAWAGEFRTVNTDAALQYDAPSGKAKRLFVVGRGFPVEVLKEQATWVHVRDAEKNTSWMRSMDLSTKFPRIQVKVEKAALYQQRTGNSRVLAYFTQNVLLVPLSKPEDGWIKVRHPDGLTGFVRVEGVWGLSS